MTALNGYGDLLRSGANPADISQAYLAYPTKVVIRGFSDDAHNDADDQGQYGLRLTWFAENLNETEFSFYHINYHSQRPLISGKTSDFTAEGIGADLACWLATNTVTRDNNTLI